jgi:hypothetical protein
MLRADEVLAIGEIAGNGEVDFCDAFCGESDRLAAVRHRGDFVNLVFANSIVSRASVYESHPCHWVFTLNQTAPDPSQFATSTPLGAFAM